ncbi:hypothetical protein B9N43_13535 [Denitratisoma sp. DHT3]|uniref:toxin-antitoxin system TumE family protein n=1 Tax=Denitratisoma sp. DHT3 TaxID=1981880 RepID=UPI00119833A1|nr:DUF6516 family protein [Denitratisoma sp. DHT3]QDX82175.1 hypothetical protein B9N43_13535 [Denitratisoma sp. DHT3]
MQHLELCERILEHYGAAGRVAAETLQDALRLNFDNGVEMEVRYPLSDAYAIAWRWGEAELRIDTAPLHPELATFPNHLHRDDGSLAADPLTRIDAAPWDNLRAVIDAVLQAPLLET